MECSIISLYLFKCVVICSITNLFKDFLHCYYIFAQLPRTILNYICRDETDIDTNEDEHVDEPKLSPACQRGLSIDDAEAVIKSLGMTDWRNDSGWGEESRWVEGASELLEEKDASEEELKEAFYLFDRNEDGFISPSELWSVMRRLGMEEGTRMEDCKRMIDAFDEDGDGKIDFLEFKRLLESAM